MSKQEYQLRFNIQISCVDDVSAREKSHDIIGRLRAKLGDDMFDELFGNVKLQRIESNTNPVGIKL